MGSINKNDFRKSTEKLTHSLTLIKDSKKIFITANNDFSDRTYNNEMNIIFNEVGFILKRKKTVQKLYIIDGDYHH